MRGQLSIEFIIVLTGLLIVVATVTMPIYNQSRSSAEKVTKLSEARGAASTLANALNNIYASGPGTRLTIDYSLPQGVVAAYVGGYEKLDVDGILTTDETVSINGRADIQIWLDLDGDGMWDNTRESVIIVDTILPSRWNESAVPRGDDWVRENCVHVEDNGLRVGSLYGTLTARTFHRATLTYCYDPTYAYPRRIVVLDEVS